VCNIRRGDETILIRLIDDINRALENEAYFAASALALTLPDICGKAKYPNERNGTRYINWYDEYVGKYEQCLCETCQENKMPYLSGEVVYQLRNSFLHQGTPNVDKNKIRNEFNKLDKFTLVIEKKNEFDIYADASSVGVERSYRVNVRRLCLILTLTAKGYYEKHMDEFNFFNFSVLEM